MSFKIFFLSGLIWVACWSLWHFTGANLWYFGNSQFIFVMLAYIHFKTEKNWQRFVSRIFLFIGFNSLWDEIIGDPTKFDINEYVIVLIFIIYSFYKWRKFSKY